MQIAIASGKGGTGKTTLAVNLAVLLSEKFAGTHRKVLLADMDVEEPDSGLFLHGKLIDEEIKYRMAPEWKEDKCTLCKHCAHICEYNALAFLGISVMVFPELCHSCYACSDLCPEDALPMTKFRIGVTKRYQFKSNLQFMESRIDIGVEQATPLIEQTRRFIDENYKSRWFTIVDAPPGTSCPVMEAVKDADWVILVTEPTPFGFHDLKLAIDTMEELRKRYAVVINKYGIGNNDVMNYCSNKKIPVIGKIPHLMEAAKLYSKGKIMIDELPEIRHEIEKIYHNICQLTGGKV